MSWFIEVGTVCQSPDLPLWVPYDRRTVLPERVGPELQAMLIRLADLLLKTREPGQAIERLVYVRAKALSRPLPPKR
jgi:hypothetical protein